MEGLQEISPSDNAFTRRPLTNRGRIPTLFSEPSLKMILRRSFFVVTIYR